MVKVYYIHDEIAIDAATIELMAINDKHGDARVELKRGKRADGEGVGYWLETNGGPRVITLDETTWSISVDQAADALGVPTDNLRAELEEDVWQ